MEIENPKTDQPYMKVTELTDASLNIDDDINKELCLINELTLQDVENLHHQFGHSSKVAELIKNSSKMTPEVSQYLDLVKSNCK